MPILQTPKITLIGAGSVGGFVGLLLAQIARFKPMLLDVFDPDTVEAKNCINQIYRDTHLDMPKVTALADILRTHSGMDIRPLAERADAATPLAGIVISAVDSMQERINIFEAIRYNAGIALYIDSRAGERLGVIYALDPRDTDQVEAYERYLHPDTSGAPAPCAEPESNPFLFAMASAIVQLLQQYAHTPLHRARTILLNYQTAPIIQSSFLT